VSEKKRFFISGIKAKEMRGELRKKRDALSERLCWARTLEGLIEGDADHRCKRARLTKLPTDKAGQGPLLSHWGGGGFSSSSEKDRKRKRSKKERRGGSGKILSPSEANRKKMGGSLLRLSEKTRAEGERTVSGKRGKGAGSNPRRKLRGGQKKSALGEGRWQKKRGKKKPPNQSWKAGPKAMSSGEFSRKKGV